MNSTTKISAMVLVFGFVLFFSGCKVFFGEDWGRDGYPCEKDNDCQDVLSCGPDGFCGEPCAGEEGCSTINHCSDAVCQPNTCSSDSDCNKLSRCDVDLGLCEDIPCDVNGDCPSILTCDERFGSCTPKKCSHDSDCAQIGAACNQERNECYLMDFPDLDNHCTEMGDETGGCIVENGHPQCVDFGFGKDGADSMYCSHFCESDFDCGPGSTCMVAYGPVEEGKTGVNTFCGDPVKIFKGIGRLCSEKEDCSSALDCLNVQIMDGSREVCTLLKCSDTTTCPAGWSCCTLQDSSDRACCVEP